MADVLREFNSCGLTTTFGNKFTFSSVKGLLQNPAYTGLLRVGYYTKEKFCNLAEDDPILIEDSHEPLISAEHFEEVQQQLSRRQKRQEGCPPGRYLFTGIVRCQHCGRKMYGVKHKPRRHDRGGRFYQCNASLGGQPIDPHCPHPAIRADRLDTFVLDTIRTRLLETGAEERIREAIIRLSAQDTKATSQDERKLLELRKKIERGTENLALAGADDFAAISKLLQRWREEESSLQDQIAHCHSDLNPIPEALRVIARLAEIRQNLDKANRAKLVEAIHLTIASITIGVCETKTGEITHNLHSGELRFHEAIGIPEVIRIPDEAIGVPKIWRDVGVLANQHDGPIRLVDLYDLIGSRDPSHASYHMRRAVIAGVVKKLPKNQGWVPP